MLMLPRGRKVGPAIFDRRNQELTHGLVSYYSPVLTGPTGLQLLDLSGQDNHGTLTNMDAPTDWIDSQWGKVLEFDGSNDHVADCGNASEFAFMINPYVFTIEVWFKLDSLSVRQALAGSTIVNSERGFSLRHEIGAGSGTNSIRLVVAHGTTGQSKDLRSPNSIVVAGWNHAVIIGRTTAANSAMVINGRQVAITASQDSTLSAGAATRAMSIGAARISSGISLPTAGQIASFAIWDRSLTINEGQSLYALEPGGLGRRLRDDFFLYETAITYFIEASTASYALTGQPIPLLYGRSLPADTGSVLLSGQTTPLLTSRLLSADQGSYAYEGTDAAMLLGRLLDAGAAAYTIDGTPAGFLASRRISADTAAYLASGLDAGFLRSRVLEAGTGQYVLVASPVNLQTGTPGTGGAAPYYYLFLLGGSR